MMTFFQKLSVTTKSILLFLGCLISVAAVMFVMIDHLNQRLATHYGIVLTLQDLWSYQFPLVCGILSVVIGILIALFSLDAHTTQKTIQSHITQSLADRHLVDQFDHLCSFHSGAELADHVSRVFELYRSFDILKKERVETEIASILTVIGQSNDGFVLINQDKIVTHVNHMAETLLKVIPSEIIGQVISRKISNDDFLTAIDDSLQNDKKVIDRSILFHDNAEFTVSIIPIKNSSNEIVRAIICLIPPTTKTSTPSQSTEEK